MSELSLNTQVYRRLEEQQENAHRSFNHDIAIVGPSGSGKSTFLYYAKNNAVIQNAPTLFFEEVSIYTKNKVLEVVEIPGEGQWKEFAGVKCVMVFVMTFNREFTRESRDSLLKARDSFPDTPILVVHSSYDVNGSIPTTEIVDFFNLPVILNDRKWNVAEWSFNAGGFCVNNIFSKATVLLDQIAQANL